jgi:heat shock protein HslJ
MKKVIVFSAILAVIFAACNTSKSTSSTPTPRKVDDASIPVTSSPSAEEEDLGGTWELVSVISEQTPFNTLYPNVKPTIAFDARPKQITGNTGCNSFTGSYSIDGKIISFGNGLTTTKMACQGNGEAIYIQRLTKANRFFIKDQTKLMLLDGDVALLEFKKILGPKSY